MIESYIDGEWYEVPFLDPDIIYGVDSLGYELQKNTDFIKEYNWKNVYGTLSEGSYRIVITFADVTESTRNENYYLAVLFDIKEE